MDNEKLIILLEEWVKEMKIEISNLNKCSITIREEISNLKNTLKLLSNLKENEDKKTEDFELRIRSLEKNDGDVLTILEKKSSDIKEIKSTSISNSTLLSTKITTNTNEIGKLRGSLTWVWRSIFMILLGILIKLLIP